MKLNVFLVVSGSLFALMALAHLARVVAGWPVVLGSHETPMWISWVAALVTGYLSVSAFRLRRRVRRLEHGGGVNRGLAADSSPCPD